MRGFLFSLIISNGRILKCHKTMRLFLLKCHYFYAIILLKSQLEACYALS